MIVQFLNIAPRIATGSIAPRIATDSIGSRITCSHSSSSVATAFRRSRRIRSLAAVSRAASACGARIRLRHARITARAPAAGLMRSKRNGHSSMCSQSSSIGGGGRWILFIDSLARRAGEADSHETRVYSAREGYQGKNGRGRRSRGKRAGREGLGNHARADSMSTSDFRVDWMSARQVPCFT